MGWREPAEHTGLTVVYQGNFLPAHSTENDVARALLANGHRVLCQQENDPAGWDRLLAAKPGEFDLMLWTRTWHLPDLPQRAVLAHLRDIGTPSVAYHLDRWWGLDREHQVRDEPMFACSLVCTADGGHDEQWREAGVDHVWFPPGISAANVGRGTPQRRYAHDVCFVGSWRPGGYHAEWTHRAELIEFLRRTYRGRLGLYPQAGVAVRGAELASIYNSAKVIVGDSCLVGGATEYLSDRIPETVGRGGFLLHPAVKGVTDGSLYTPGEHLDTWELGDWDGLRERIDHYLAHPADRERISEAGMRHVAESHTYERRTQVLIEDVLPERGLLHRRVREPAQESGLVQRALSALVQDG